MISDFYIYCENLCPLQQGKIRLVVGFDRPCGDQLLLDIALLNADKRYGRARLGPN